MIIYRYKINKPFEVGGKVMKYTIYRIGRNPLLVNDYEDYVMWYPNVLKVVETKTGKVVYEK